jgi:polyisoprenoid-binding protein YceI
MMTKIIAALTTALLLVASAAITTAATYTLDPAHSSVTFSVKHMAISRVNGQFGSFTASFDYDPAQPETWSAQASIDAASITTFNDRRDAHLRSEDFLFVEKFPTVTFKSTKLRHVEGDRYEMVGELSLRGVTRPVTLAVVYNGSIVGPRGDQRVGFTATTTINRKDFGVAWNNMIEATQVAGDQVDITIQAEGIKQEAAKPQG